MAGQVQLQPQMNANDANGSSAGRESSREMKFPKPLLLSGARRKNRTRSDLRLLRSFAAAVMLALAMSMNAQPLAAQVPDSTVNDSLSFSVGELYMAFGLTMSEDDAYRMTKSLTTFRVRDKGVEIQKTDGRKLSEDILILLSLVSDSTAAKVGAVRRAGRASVTPEEEKQWAQKVETMRKLAGGKKP
jgi:hypothetical protein